MASVFCSKCGRQVSDNASVCPSCGHARTGIPASSARPAAQGLAPVNHPAGHETPGFFKILLNASFSDFITLKLIKWLYILGCIVCAIGALSALATLREYTQGSAGILLLWPVLFIVLVVLLRVWLELVASIFRIAENTTQMAEDLDKR